MHGFNASTSLPGFRFCCSDQISVSACGAIFEGTTPADGACDVRRNMKAWNVLVERQRGHADWRAQTER